MRVHIEQFDVDDAIAAKVHSNDSRVLVADVL